MRAGTEVRRQRLQEWTLWSQERVTVTVGSPAVLTHWKRPWERTRDDTALVPARNVLGAVCPAPGRVTWNYPDALHLLLTQVACAGNFMSLQGSV